MFQALAYPSAININTVQWSMHDGKVSTNKSCKKINLNFNFRLSFAYKKCHLTNYLKLLVILNREA